MATIDVYNEATKETVIGNYGLFNIGNATNIICGVVSNSLSSASATYDNFFIIGINESINSAWANVGSRSTNTNRNVSFPNSTFDKSYLVTKVMSAGNANCRVYINGAQKNVEVGDIINTREASSANFNSGSGANETRYFIFCMEVIDNGTTT